MSVKSFGFAAAATSVKLAAGAGRVAGVVAVLPVLGAATVAVTIGTAALLATTKAAEVLDNGFSKIEAFGDELKMKADRAKKEAAGFTVMNEKV